MTDDFAPSVLNGEDEAYAVRPYAVTAGRIFGEADGLAIESLVSATDAANTAKGLTPERKKIIKLASEDFVSVAELAAHCKLPLGVIRVLVMDMTDTGYLTIHATTLVSNSVDDRSGITRSLLESVLDGIAAL
jgi:hypothetical protein